MKKGLIIAVLAIGVLFVGKANAQINVHAGFTPEAWTSTYNNNVSTTTLNSFFVGGTYNLNLSGDLNLAIGGQLRYGTKTGTESVLGGFASGKSTTTVIGLDIPILLNYTLKLSSDLGLTIFAGPKVTYNFVGKTVSEASVAGISGSSTYNWFDDNGNYKPFNAAIAGGASLNFKQFRLFGGYSYGLTDSDKSDSYKTTVGGPFFGLGMSL